MGLFVISTSIENKEYIFKFIFTVALNEIDGIIINQAPKYQLNVKMLKIIFNEK
jgi:hypothetical protein